MSIWKNILNATFWTNVDTYDFATFDAGFYIGLACMLTTTSEDFSVKFQALLHIHGY